MSSTLSTHPKPDVDEEETPPPTLHRTDPDDRVPLINRDTSLDMPNSGGDGNASVAVEGGGFAEPRLEHLPTIPWAMAGIFTNLVMIVLVFVLPILCESHKDGAALADLCPLQPFSILVYTHAGHWVVHLFVDQYLKQQHRKSRLNGYIEFYLSTKNIRRTPFYLVSVGNAGLLITVTALSDYCVSHDCNDKFSKVDLLRGLMTLECLTIMFLWGYYIINVRQFHAAKALPDVLRADARRRMMISLGKIGEDEVDEEEVYGVPLDERERGDVLEKQAELIRYLHSHIEKQNEKITALVRQQIAAGHTERF